LKEKYFIYTILAGFLLGRIIHQMESVVLKLFALALTFTIATACAYAYNAERRDFSGINETVHIDFPSFTFYARAHAGGAYV